jgi:hypothetical protein
MCFRLTRRGRLRPRSLTLEWHTYIDFGGGLS